MSLNHKKEKELSLQLLDCSHHPSNTAPNHESQGKSKEVHVSPLYEDSSRDESRGSVATSGSTNGISSHSSARSSVSDAADPFQLSSIEKSLQKHTESLKTHINKVIAELKDDIMQRVHELEGVVTELCQANNFCPPNGRLNNTNSTTITNLSLHTHSPQLQSHLRDNVRASTNSDDSVKSEIPTEAMTSSHVSCEVTLNEGS